MKNFFIIIVLLVLLGACNKSILLPAGRKLLTIKEDCDAIMVKLPNMTYSHKEDPNTRYPLKVILIKTPNDNLNLVQPGSTTGLPDNTQTSP